MWETSGNVTNYNVYLFNCKGSGCTLYTVHCTLYTLTIRMFSVTIKDETSSEEKESFVR